MSFDLKRYQKKYRNSHKEKARAYGVIWRAANKVKITELNRAYSKENAIKIRKRVKAWTSKNPKRAFNNWLKSKYGITYLEYDKMVKAQRGVCKICSQKGKINRRLHIDHCHTTGRVRGLICYYCNLMLGLAKDNPNTLRNAAKYLENFSKKLNIKRGKFDAPLS